MKTQPKLHNAIKSIVYILTALALPVAMPHARAQQAPAAKAETTGAASPIREKDLKNSEADDDIVQLSKFTVSTSSKEDGYRATDTLAGTRLKSDLKDVAASISVVTTKFLQDTGAKNNQTLLQYTTNTEVGGIGGNYGSKEAEGTNLQSVDYSILNPSQNTRVRGLMSADNSRDYMITQIPWDGYNVDRVDLQRGPNSILFGLGSPAGLINVGLKQAGYSDKGEVGFTFGSYGSTRLTMDFNKAIVPKQLAIHFDFLDDDTQFRQDPTYNHDRRFYGALRADPKFLAKNGMHTTLKINFEGAKINANRPSSMPPSDQVTQWFQTGTSYVQALSSSGAVATVAYPNMNKSTFDGIKYQIVDYPIYPDTYLTPDYGVTKPGTPNFQPWAGIMGTLFSNTPVSYFPSANASMAPSANQTANSMTYFTVDPTGARTGSGLYGFYSPMGIASYSAYAQNAKLQFTPVAPYYDKSLTDASVFDYWNNSLAGPNSKQWQKFNTFNINLNQTFFNNRVGVEFVYDKQNYSDGMQSGLDWNAITIDVNKILADGSSNPNLGRPFVENSNLYGNMSRQINSEAYRFTAYGELNFNDFMNKGSWLTKLLGRHVFTGFWSYNKDDSETRKWARYALDPSYMKTINNDSSNLQLTDRTRVPASLAYIGPSYLGSNYTTAVGLNLTGLKASQQMPSSMPVYYYDSHWNAPGSVNPGDPWTHISTSGSTSGQTVVGTQNQNPANYVGWRTQNFPLLNAENGDDINQLYFAGARAKSKLQSMGIVWQGFFWDGVVVPTIGLRQDRKTTSESGSTVSPLDEWGVATMDYPGSKLVYMSPLNSHSYGIVIHTPKNIVDKMPLKTELSLFAYNGENYRVGAVAVDIYNRALPVPEGKTKEYGFLINTLDSHLSFKMTWYDTKTKNDRMGASLNTYMVGRIYDAYWVNAKREYVGLMQKDLPDSDPNKIFKSTNMTYVWDWSGNAAKMQKYGSQQAVWDAEKQILEQFLARPIDTTLCNTWGIDLSDNNPSGWKYNNYISPKSEPQGMDTTVDQEAQGIEMELTAHPIAGLDITLNVSKNTAQRTNLGGFLKTYVEGINSWIQGPQGDIPLWWGGGDESIRDNWNVNFMSGYNLITMLEGADVPELRPWRFNIVANYAFQKSWAKGLSFGGGYRWEDKVVLGFPVGNDGRYDLSKPCMGPSDWHLDFWIGYGRKLTRTIDWRIQLNVRDAFAQKKLIPVTVQPDGTSAGYRIPSLTTWQISNTISF